MRDVALSLLGCAAVSVLSAQGPAQPDWTALQDETMKHFQALLRLDTSDPPGNEQPAAEYLKQTLEREGIAVQTFALEPHRPNVVARLKGSGKKRPVLLMGHTDVVNVDAKKWKFPAFSATRDGGYVYGRGSVDDKDNVVSGLMVMLLLKRLNVPLDRDVIFLAEAGEEGSTRVGIQFMVNQHFNAIDAEYCYAEGGNVSRQKGQVKYAAVQTLEKIPYAVEVTARGPSGHGSVPLGTNAVARLAAAVDALARWRAPIRLNETTATYFDRLAGISSPEDAERYRSVADPAKAPAAYEHLFAHEPRHAAMLRTTISPNIMQAGYRLNVIPSEARATLDVRALSDERMPAFLDELKKVVNDPSVDVSFGKRDVRPASKSMPLDAEGFKVLESAIRKHYSTVTLPTMSTGATDMAYLRAKGMKCYGVGPAIDVEDGPLGFGAHSDQERLLEAELYRFVRFQWDVVRELAKAESSTR
jgi:acetylornithine deacetylase/succinyl-diaminopimelate desuccinylase-like protein